MNTEPDGTAGRNRWLSGAIPIRWPHRMLGPAPGLREINLVCWGLLLGLAVVPLCTPIWLSIRSGAGVRGILPIDFVYFYGIGRLCNRYSVARLYDYALQLRVFNDIFPVSDGAYGPSPYPPLVAMFFGVYARLSLSWAYLAWSVTSLALYLAGIGAAMRAARIDGALRVSLILCLALGFSPFLVSTLGNGQLSAVAVFAIGLAILEERNARYFVSGMLLSCLSYKPTLLLLILPMLLLTRRFRTLAGFATGVAILAGFTTAFTGLGIWPDYVAFLRSFSQAAGVNGQSVLVRWKYVDLISFLYGIPGGRSAAGMAILAALALALAGWLAVLLWKSARSPGPVQGFAWAATLTWTLLLNVYVPMYDAILVAVAAILTIGALRELEFSIAESWVTLIVVGMLGISWFTIPVARSHGMQLLTVCIFVFGLAQLCIFQRVTHRTGSLYP